MVAVGFIDPRDEHPQAVCLLKETCFVIRDYTDWRDIEYRPAIPTLPPHSLVPFLRPQDRVLEVGCNVGAVTRFLARHVCHVTGVDINPTAIDVARSQPVDPLLTERISFVAADFLNWTWDRPFDVVVLIRVVGCFSESQSWLEIVRRSKEALRKEGLLYVHDFLTFEESYRSRYEEGERAGWRRGNFPVRDAAGRLQCVAHHHSEDEVAQIAAGCSVLARVDHETLSMNGNRGRMFELIARRN